MWPGPPASPLTDQAITLRPPSGEDLRGFDLACLDVDLRAWIDPGATVEEHVREGSPPRHRTGALLLAQFQAGWRERTAATFVYVPEPNALHAVGALVRERDPEVAEVAYWVDPAVRRRGLATRVVRLMADWAFEEVAVKRLWLEIEPGNDASHGVARRAAFRREGILRSHCRDRMSGRRHDCVVYSLLPTDPRRG